ncbi:hypothetical protein [Pseudoflavitalea rhizosphaerae]|uniref:hypothetical protein n=1 Tax=Pseudoflavitalea rhizosphaerae TaxID=1884793 RepID=UPI000F8F8087|nr:hypothetical protein [Pseudoflavitalea rhizosphaerae]
MNKRLINIIACAFSKILKEWLTYEQLSFINKRNDSEGFNSSFCASHQFCDANMAMNEAFRRVLQRDANVNCCKDTSIWNEAWDIAKKEHFFIEP